MVREIYENELSKLLNLYLYLHEKSVPERTEHLKTTWETIIKDNARSRLESTTTGKYPVFTLLNYSSS